MNSDPLALDLWTEFFEELRQSGCRNLEAELRRPLVCTNLEETLKVLKKLWAYTTLSEESLVLSDSILEISKNPFAKLHPLGRTLTFLLLKKIGAQTFPLVPMRPLISLFESCQLALLWAIAGHELEGQTLASRLFPLTFLPTLWCKEEEFSEKEVTLSIALLKRAFQQPVETPREPIDPYFLALAKLSPRWEYPLSFPHRIVDPELGLLYQRNDHFVAAVSLAGEGTPLGSFSTHSIEVRAFGPQLPPFNESKRFGILRLPDSQPMERWTSVAALPEVWMEAKPQFEREECTFAIRFFGQTVEKPIYFSFYVKAPDCEIGGEILRPRTLKRFQGEAKPALFGKKLKIESLLPGKMEVIPLAGEGGFWNCDFLLTFEVLSFEARGEYRLQIKCS